MRTTVVLDDDLIARAQELTGITEKSALLQVALKELLEGRAAMRLAHSPASHGRSTRSSYTTSVTAALRCAYSASRFAAAGAVCPAAVLSTGGNSSAR